MEEKKYKNIVEGLFFNVADKEPEENQKVIALYMVGSAKVQYMLREDIYRRGRFSKEMDWKRVVAWQPLD